MPCDGLFLSRFFWCQVHLENLTTCFDPHFPSSCRIDFLGWESWDTQPSCVDSFNNATDPFVPPFFDFLLGFSSVSTCLKKHGHTCIQSQTCSFEGCQILHDGFFTNCVTARNLAPFVWRAFICVAWCFWWFFSLVVSLGLRIWCGRGRSSFSSLTTVQVSSY